MFHILGVEVFQILGEGDVEVFHTLCRVVLRWEWNVLSQVGSDPEV